MSTATRIRVLSSRTFSNLFRICNLQCYMNSPNLARIPSSSRKWQIIALQPGSSLIRYPTSRIRPEPIRSLLRRLRALVLESTRGLEP
jgi:hypothetical protein